MNFSEDDFDRRLETCDTLRKNDGPYFVDNVICTDESKFTLSGYVNRHSCVLWSIDNPPFTVDHAFNSIIPKELWFGLDYLLVE